MRLLPTYALKRAVPPYGFVNPIILSESSLRGGFNEPIESSQAWLVAKVVPGESQAFLLFLYGCRMYWAQIHMKIDFVRI